MEDTGDTHMPKYRLCGKRFLLSCTSVHGIDHNTVCGLSTVTGSGILENIWTFLGTKGQMPHGSITADISTADVCKAELQLKLLKEEPGKMNLHEFFLLLFFASNLGV